MINQMYDNGTNLSDDMLRIIDLGLKYDIQPWHYQDKLTGFGFWLETWLMKLGVIETDPGYDLHRFWWFRQKLGLPYRRSDFDN